MFGQQQNTGFGGFGAQQPAQGGLFGQQPQQSAFGAPVQTTAFGTQATPFGAPAQQQPSAFGATTSSFGGFGTQNRPAFGAAPQPSTGIFGAQTQNAPSTGFGAFGATANTTAQPATGLFGAKPAGFGTTTGGFGQTTTAAPAFGAGTTTAFGQQPTTSAFGGAATTGFGGMSAGNQTSPTQNLGTGNPSFQPFREQDTSAAASTTNIFHTITAMPNYKNWSLEELRLQDYLMGKKAPSAAPATGFGTTTTGFGAQPASTGLFGTTTTTTGFGQPQQQTGGLFGTQQTTAPATGFGFGQTQQQQPATSAFGQPAQQPSGGLFGSTTTTGFGAQPATQPTTGFGTTTTATTGFGGFGAAQNQQAKPAFGFGATATPPAQTGGFGFGQTAQQQPASTSPFGFGQQQAQQPAQQQTTGFSLFGAKPATTAAPTTGGFGFGAATTQPGQPSGFGFGATAAPTQPAPASGAFSFGAPAATTAPATGTAFSFAQPAAQPAAAATGFSFGAPAQQPAATGGLFGAAPATTQPAGGLFGATAAKPATGLFGAPATTQAPASTFSFGQPASSTGTSLFGAAAPATSQPAFGGFGAAPAQAAAPVTGGLFGSATTAPTTSLFGAAPAAQPAFGASTQQPAAPALGGSIFGSAPTNVGFGTSLPPGQQPLVAAIDQHPYGINPVLEQANSTAAGPSAPSVALPFGAASTNGTSGSGEQPRRPPPLPQFKVTPRLQTRLKLKNYLGGAGSAVPPSELGVMNSFETAISTETFNPRKNIKKLILPEADILSSSVGIGSSSRLRGGPKEITWADDEPAEPTRTEEPSRKAGAPEETNGSIYPSLSDSASGSGSVLRPKQPSTPATPGFEGGRSGTAGPSRDGSPRPAAAASPRSPGYADATEYKTTPSMTELVRRSDDELRRVQGFSVELPGFGKVTFLEPVDLLQAAPDGTVATINLIPSRVVVIRHKLVVVYPGEEGKPEVGQGLNVPARIELDNCWPLDRASRQPIREPSNERMKLHIKRLEKMEGTEFISFDPSTGKWIFKVLHFTVYGLLHEGEDNDDIIRENVDFVENEEGYMMRTFLDGSNPQFLGLGMTAEDMMMDGSFVEDSFAFTKRAAPQRRMIRRSEEEVDDDFGDLMDEPSQVEMDDTEEDELQRLAMEPSEVLQEETVEEEPSAIEEPSQIPLDTAMASEVPDITSFAPSLQQSMKASLFEKRSTRAPRGQAIPTSSNASRPFFGVSPPVLNFGLPLSQTTREEERVEGGPVLGVSMELDQDGARKEPSETERVQRVPVAMATKTLRELDTVAPISKSITNDKEAWIADAGLSMGRSFRVGWGPNGTFLGRGAVKNGAFNFSTVVVRSIDVYASGGSGSAKVASTQTLQRHLEHSLIERKNDEAPTARVIPGSKFGDYVSLTSGNSDFTETEQQAWKLGKALLDPLDIPSEREISIESSSDLGLPQKQYVREMYRKAAISRWLRSAVGRIVLDEIEKRGRQDDVADLVFTHLSGCNVAKACAAAISIGDVRLATVLSQLGASGMAPGAVRSRLPGQGPRAPKAASFGHGLPGSNFTPLAVVEHIKNQIHVWNQPGNRAPIHFIDEKRRRLWELAAGDVASNIVGGYLKDWKRVFGLFLWYGDGGANSVGQALAKYEAAYTSQTGPKLVKPLPLYMELQNTTLGDASLHFDVLYHLLKLFASDTHLLEAALHPLNVSPNPLDYRLPWLLYTMLSRSYKAREFKDTRVDSVVIEQRDDMALDGDSIERNAGFEVIGGTTADNLAMSLAFQLEKVGLWQWAIYVCLFLSTGTGREQSIRELLCRNFPLEDKSDSVIDRLDFREDAGQHEPHPNSAMFDFLTKKLMVPAPWIHEAKALRARCEGSLLQELSSLLDAKLYSAAHRLMVRILAPRMIFNDRFVQLRRLLAEIQDPSAVDDWNVGGDLLLTYMEVIAPDGESTSADTLQRFPAIEFPATPSPSAAGRPFQATTFGVPAVATVRADGRPSSALQSILDRIVDAERLPVGTGRVGFSEQERKAEDLDRRACLAHMRKRVERLMVERRKKERFDERNAYLQPPASTDAWFQGVGQAV